MAEDINNPTEEQVAQYGDTAEAIDQSTQQPDQSQAITNPVQPPANAPQVPTQAQTMQPAPDQVPASDQEGKKIQQKAMGVPSKAAQNFTESPIPMVDPSVKRASNMYNIAEALAGGPKYKYNIDVNTGKMEKTPVPVSGKHLGLALALEALSGGLTGLAAGRGKGPGAAGAAAFQQAEQRVQDRDAQARQQANADYTRGAAIAKTNLTMLRNEQITSQADEEFQQKDVDSHAGLYSDLTSLNAVKQQGLTGDQIQQMIQKGQGNVTKDMFVPYQVIPMMDKDGKPVLTPHGAPKFEKLYAQIDPSASLSPPQDLLDKAVKYKIPGFVNPNTGEALPLPSDMQLKAHMVVGLAEQVRKFEMNDEAAKRYNSMIDSGENLQHVAHSGTSADALSNQPAPKIHDPELSAITDKAADDHGVPSALLHAVGIQESGGNPNVANSKPNDKGVYAVGPFQVTLGTARSVTGNPNLTEADLKDPKTNADIASQYLSKLLDQNGGDQRKALIAYHGAGADSLGMTGAKYADQVLAKIPQTIPNMPEGEKGTPVMAPSDAISKNLLSPKDLDTLNSSLFNGLQNALDGNHSTKEIEDRAAKMKGADAGAVGRLLSVYGTAIDERYNQHQLQLQKQKEQMTLDIAAGKAKITQDATDKLESQGQAMLHVPEGFHQIPGILDMSSQDAAKELKKQGVVIPDNFADLFAIAKNDSHVTGLSPRVYKGVTGVPGISQSMGKSYVLNFLNPGWQEQHYTAKQNYVNDLLPKGTTGSILYNAGTATQHLQLAEQLFQNMNNRQAPEWNKVANWLGKDIAGLPEAAVYDLVANQMANEVSKVTTGGKPTLEEGNRLKAQLGTYQSPAQAAANFGGLIKLMLPRFDGAAHEAEGVKAVQDYRNAVTPNTVKVFAQHGEDVPGFGSPIYDKGHNLIGVGYNTPDGKIQPTLMFK